MIKLPVPPREEQRHIVHGINESIQEVEAAEGRINREINLLREYRTRLIADVVTGKLDIREAAAQLPDESQELEIVDDTEDLSDTNEEQDNNLDCIPKETEA